jgi:hypothetical protein
MGRVQLDTPALAARLVQLWMAAAMRCGLQLREVLARRMIVTVAAGTAEFLARAGGSA